MRQLIVLWMYMNLNLMSVPGLINGYSINSVHRLSDTECSYDCGEQPDTFCDPATRDCTPCRLVCAVDDGGHVGPEMCLTYCPEFAEGLRNKVKTTTTASSTSRRTDKKEDNTNAILTVVLLAFTVFLLLFLLVILLLIRRLYPEFCNCLVVLKKFIKDMICKRGYIRVPKMNTDNFRQRVFRRFGLFPRNADENSKTDTEAIHSVTDSQNSDILCIDDKTAMASKHPESLGSHEIPVCAADSQPGAQIGEGKNHLKKDGSDVLHTADQKQSLSSNNINISVHNESPTGNETTVFTIQPLPQKCDAANLKSNKFVVNNSPTTPVISAQKELQQTGQASFSVAQSVTDPQLQQRHKSSTSDSSTDGDTGNGSSIDSRDLCQQHSNLRGSLSNHASFNNSLRSDRKEGSSLARVQQSDSCSKTESSYSVIDNDEVTYSELENSTPELPLNGSLELQLNPFHSIAARSEEEEHLVQVYQPVSGNHYDGLDEQRFPGQPEYNSLPEDELLEGQGHVGNLEADYNAINPLIDAEHRSLPDDVLPRSYESDSAVGSIIDPAFMDRSGFHELHYENNYIYDQLQNIHWVLGYHSQGRSISVYADLDTYDPDDLHQELVDVTHQPWNKFRIKQNDM